MIHPDAPGELARSVIIASVHCRQCGYDLRGLSPVGQCPECGLDIWQTILHTVDPAASRLPKLRNPKAVGDGLVWTVFCAFLSLLLLVAAPALAIRGAVSWAGYGLALPRDLPLLAAIVALLGLAGPWKLLPPKGQEPGGPVRRSIWLLFAGLGGWAGLAAAPWIIRIASGSDFVMSGIQRAQWHLAMALVASVFLMGLEGVLRAIGQRSREYRTARGGRQSVQVMIAAVIFLALGEIIRWLALAMHNRTGWLTRGTVIVWTCTLMLVIGLAYLVMNAWWIRRSLRRPPPPLKAILQQR